MVENVIRVYGKYKNKCAEIITVVEGFRSKEAWYNSGNTTSIIYS